MYMATKCQPVSCVQGVAINKIDGTTTIKLMCAPTMTTLENGKMLAAMKTMYICIYTYICVHVYIYQKKVRRSFLKRFCKHVILCVQIGLYNTLWNTLKWGSRTRTHTSTQYSYSI